MHWQAYNHPGESKWGNDSDAEKFSPGFHALDIQWTILGNYALPETNFFNMTTGTD